MATPPVYARRVLSRLAHAELREPDPHAQDDLRISWITVLHASRGYVAPHVSASYAVLGLHPDKVWPAIVERRKALLGRLYGNWYEKFSDVDLPPKKPSRSVRLEEVRLKANGAN